MNGDIVIFYLNTTHSSVCGKVHYVGPVPQSKGTYFGIEILVSSGADLGGGCWGCNPPITFGLLGLQPPHNILKQ